MQMSNSQQTSQHTSQQTSQHTSQHTSQPTTQSDIKFKLEERHHFGADSGAQQQWSRASSLVPQNPFSKTTSSSFAATEAAKESGEQRSSVILAPARLVANANAGGNALNSVGGGQTSAQPKFMLRPSVLRIADSSTNNSQNSQSDVKSFAFVSLSKEDITPPATTLFQRDDAVSTRLGADAISPFNGDEPPVSSTTSADTTSSTTLTTTAATPVNSERETPTSTVLANNSDNDVNHLTDHSDNSNSNSNFVFGENLEDRAMKPANSNAQNSANECVNSTDDINNVPVESHGLSFAGLASSSMVAEPSTVDNNNLSAIKTTPEGVLDLSAGNSESVSPEKNNGADHKRKYEVITGEEDEQNVLAMYCRLYAWESETSTWKERGRGSLRLNDVIKDDKLCSRIVMRTSGALRVILNTHLLAGMKFELANEQCLRFTNVDGIYLIKGTPKDVDQLNSAIDYRMREIAKRLKSGTTEIDDVSNDSCLSNNTL